MKKFYAHSIEGKPVEEWHLLEEHLQNVARMAAEFGCGECGRLAGEGHDLNGGIL
jgi:CRISPR-associated endonuclease/helicase Cas3